MDETILTGEPEGGPSMSPGVMTGLLAELARTPEVHGSATRAPGAGDRLGRYLLVREIGRGGFGTVFEAEDLALRRRVALKVLRPVAGRRLEADWIVREGEAAARLRHPGVVTLHDAGTWDGGAFLVYELLAGQTLAARLAEGPIPRHLARRMLGELARALAHVHGAGVVHRDVKPDNVFLDSGGAVKLLDLGIAQAAGAVGIRAGSPPFAAPEQWRGDACDASADVFAWGVLAHLLLAGEPPAGPPARPTSLRPGSLRALAAACLSPDPLQRPADGAALVAALERLERSRSLRRLAGLAASGLAIAALAFGASRALQARSPPPDGPFRVAVADAENGSGDPALDGIGDLVARGLDGAARLLVMDHARIGGVLRAGGQRPPDRLDRDAATKAARQAGAAVVVVPAVEQTEDGLRLRLEAFEPETGRNLFAIAEPATEAATVPEAVDRLSRRGRDALLARETDARPPDREIARSISSSMEAHRRYLDGLRCTERPGTASSATTPAGCEHFFEEALAVDPDFPLAHFELLRSRLWQAYPVEDLRPLLDRAMLRVDRLPPREQAQVRAWSADWAGDRDGAVALLRAAMESWPEDAKLALALGELHHREGRPADAVEPFERAVALDPGLEPAVDGLVWSLGLLDRRDALVALADRLARAAPSATTLVAESRARAFGGDLTGALDVARRAAPDGTGPARDNLEEALVAAGEWGEAERMLREDAADGSDRARGRLSRLLVMRGRDAEASRIVPRDDDEADPRWRFVRGAREAYSRAWMLDAAAVGRLAQEVRRWSPSIAATLAPLLAYVGDVDGALALAPEMDEGEGDDRVLHAIVVWRTDGALAALPLLRALARGEPVAVQHVLPPEAVSWLAAECASEVALDDAALGDLQRFQRFFHPLGIWRAWAYPRSLLLEARIEDALGRHGAARVALARLEGLWAAADPDQPLLAEAASLRRHVGTGGNPVATAPDGRGP